MMNDGMLSQDEIDALLKISDDEDEELASDDHETNTTEALSTIEKDTLGEIGNISFGSSATTLSTLLNQKVEITTPEVTVIEKSSINEAFNFDHVTIEVNYKEGFTGKNVLVMKTDDAAVIADIMLGGDGTSPESQLTDIHLSAVQEVMNQMMGSAATSMSKVFDKRVDISPPTISQSDPPNEMDVEALPDDDIFVRVSFRLEVGQLIDSHIMQLVPLPFAKNLVEQLLQKSSSEQAEEEAAGAVEPLERKTYQASQKTSSVNQSANDQAQPQMIGSKAADHTTVQQAAFTEFEQVELDKNEQRNLNMLLDIPLSVTVELGRTKRTIKDILDLTSGSIIELDKLAGEHVDILVNEKLVAKGEVVVIDENFGVRVTDIISRADRLINLK
ncbi:MAG TPA: flagellar motor switch phosphatase FliY [Bacillota bacterium]|nr:flagellar motor switch phosphatase FliY [Bacillota bacterium]